MANETLIARLEQSLRQSRGARTRLSARLAELESEAEIIRAELIEMDTLAGQTEAAIFRLLSNVMNGPSTQVGTTSVGELEIELQRRLAQAELSQHPLPQQRHNVPVLRSDIEPTSDKSFFLCNGTRLAPGSFPTLRVPISDLRGQAARAGPFRRGPDRLRRPAAR